MSLKPLALDKLKTIPLAKRQIEADGDDFGAPYQAGGNFSDFLCSLPGLGAAKGLITLRDAIVSAHRRGRSVVLGLGGHVIDSGLSPSLVRLLEQRVITGLCLTGAACLQDVEIALSGHTVRYTDKDLHEGHYGVTEETGRLINDAVTMGAIEGWGMGNAIGRKLIDSAPDHLDYSVLATACRYGIPVTVHPAIGADAFNLHPASHGESLGACGYTDFKLLAAILADASHGVIINVASSVLLPRLFLQAMDAARNLGKTIEGITSVVIDSSASTSAIDDVVHRLSQPDGQGIYLPGPDEILLPLVFAAVIDTLGSEVE